MAYNTVQDIVLNPEVISAIMTQEWALKSRFVSSGIFRSESLPVEGLQSTTILEKRWQGESRQALKAGQDISSINRVQASVKWPILFGYASVDEPKLAEEVEKKGVDVMRANIAQDAQNAGIQFIDDSCIKLTEGVGTMLTSNAYDATTSTGTVADIAIAQGNLGDNQDAFLGGAIVMRGSFRQRLIAAGLVTTVVNPSVMTIDANSGKQQDILGMTPILTNKLALASDGDVFTYLVAREALGLAYESARIQITAKEKAFETYITKLYTKYMIGAYGVTFGGAAAEDVSDTDLATDTNWTLVKLDQSLVGISQLRTTV